MTGVLEDGRVVVADPAEASTLHNKGAYGTPRSGGGLALDLVEACFLVELGRLAVEDASLVDVMAEGTRRGEGFEIRYLVYRDLRQRGFVVALTDRDRFAFAIYPRGQGPKDGVPPKAVVAPLSERAPFRLADLLADLDRAAGGDAPPPLYALVDEESDVTYYRVEALDGGGGDGKRPDAATGAGTDAKAAPRDEARPPGEVLLLEDRAVVPDPDLGATLHDAGFYGRLVEGTLQISLVETAHLQALGLSVRDGRTGKPVDAEDLGDRAREVQPDFDLRVRTYRALRRRGLVPKTGFKFGTHFRVYTDDPEVGHAEWLVHALPAGFEGSWPEVAGFVRLAHSVRKTMVFACFHDGGHDGGGEGGRGAGEGETGRGEGGTGDVGDGGKDGDGLRTVALTRARP